MGATGGATGGTTGRATDKAADRETVGATGGATDRAAAETTDRATVGGDTVEDDSRGDGQGAHTIYSTSRFSGILTRSPLYNNYYKIKESSTH